MNRLFGTGGRKNNEQLLQESNDSLNKAQDNLNNKISQIDTQIVTIVEELKILNLKLKKNPKNSVIKQKCLKLLNKKKQLETTRNQLDNQHWSIQQTQLTSDNLINTMVTVDAMKKTNSVLKKQYNNINIDKLQDLQDEMADLIDQGNELQDLISSGFNTNANYEDELDMEDLDDELDALMDEDFGDTAETLEAALAEGSSTTTGGGELANSDLSYLNNAVPKFVDTEEQQESLSTEKEAV